ncbi:hypothetical protein Daura_24975 [Dactylosporangium aurantiacum]|uniref:Uncharacterized protein n=1 Tax=Dactylosporangium aurantiacum TaxID=35754 RepID=A0A9Q9MNB0_9ACTN|nr:hypothetical protein [Dactylosporangium aurantiacum]MDG6108660.1 hypothetical protein [Dactylosporangium aurantiacum]UWZ59126.1 hypothetical protein Daura_24975 [Dactylosporangium aurantiacum]
MCLPPSAGADLAGALGAAMAPFEAMCGYPAERDQWQPWTIAASHGFRMRPGAADDPRTVLPRPDGTCAGGPGELLDLAGWWIERNYRPVHGACDSLAGCPHREGRTEPWTWVDIAAYLERLPGDVLIVRLRCHV